MGTSRAEDDSLSLVSGGAPVGARQGRHFAARTRSRRTPPPSRSSTSYLPARSSTCTAQAGPPSATRPLGLVARMGTAARASEVAAALHAPIGQLRPAKAPAKPVRDHARVADRVVPALRTPVHRDPQAGQGPDGTLSRREGRGSGGRRLQQRSGRGSVAVSVPLLGFVPRGALVGHRDAGADGCRQRDRAYHPEDHHEPPEHSRRVTKRTRQSDQPHRPGRRVEVQAALPAPVRGSGEPEPVWRTSHKATAR